MRPALLSFVTRVSLLGSLCLAAPWTALAQVPVSVTTFHNDNSRTGQNVNEIVLTPSNVNSNQFGKLFSVTVTGVVYAQPLYLANVSINGGTHNVLYVATEHDMLYAIDADSGAVYWNVSLIPAGGSTVNSVSDANCSDLVPEIGITGTPVIDPSTNTIYVVTHTKEAGLFFYRLHALDVVTSAEKFGGPVVLTDVNGQFDPIQENQRPALLLVNGHVIIAWSSHCDNSPWHGWVMSYSASALAREAVLNTTPTGNAAGVWMSGDGVAADSAGNLFFATGNGTYDGAANGNYGDSIMKVSPPSGGNFIVADWFTPFNQSSLSAGDHDVGSGGVLLLPDLPAGSAHQQLLVEMGKEGWIFVVDRNNMGQFCLTCTSQDTQIVQEIPGASVGIWGSPAYWNDNVYWGGGNDSGGLDSVKAFSFNANNSGLLSTSPTSNTSQAFSFGTGAPVISANGTASGILWILDNGSWQSTCCQVLYAYDATNLANMLYNSNQALNSRDVPGGAVKFTAPTIANGKVYVGSQGVVSAFGVLSTTPTAATPTFSPAPGSYVGNVSVAVSDATSGAVVHCTTDGSTPTANSPTACSSISLTITTTVKAFAVGSGLNASAVASGTYTITTGTGINYGAGFSSSGLTLNGNATINGTRLRLTTAGAQGQAGSAFASTPINVQNFTTDFSLQLSSPDGDGMTFTIQNAGVHALGPNGGGLGYGPTVLTGTPGIAKSVAVKFDLYSNNGEGPDSTGLYTNGASPTTPAIDMTSSGVNLHSGDVFNVHMTYNGAALTMTIADASVPADTFTTSWTVNIPSVVGGNTAFIGFTGGTGGSTATQEVITWTYTASTASAVVVQVTPPTVTLQASQGQTFTAAVTGTTTTAVTWAMTPQVGTLTPNGQTANYTAPASIGATSTVNVTATSTADTSKAATAVVTLSPPAGSFSPIRVHAGGASYTDSQGNLWTADTGFVGGNTASTTHAISNTTDPKLYQSERYGGFSYVFTVPNGNYNVVLKFAEIYWSSAGQRIFNVAINGTTVLSNFDIVAQAGAAFTALDKTFPVTVTNGSIAIQFTNGSADLPKVSAIGISSASGVFVRVTPPTVTLQASQGQTFTAAVTGTTTTAVTWAMTPQVGTLTPNGQTANYTAPASIGATSTVNVTATSTADTSKAATAVVTLSPPAGSFSPIRVHAGGASYTDSQGNLWTADTGFVGGNTASTTHAISNTTDPKLYQSERYGGFSYVFTVPNGNYNVVLKFAEIYWSSAGQRIFNVAINGTTVLSNFDIVAQAGAAFTALDKTFPVTVTNGSIAIQFTNGSADLPKVSAIYIH